MKTQRQLTIRRTGDRFMLTDKDGGGELKDMSLTVTLPHPEAAKVINAYKAGGVIELPLYEGSPETRYLSSAAVEEIQARDYTPAPHAVRVYQGASGALYLQRADEDEGLIYRVDAIGPGGATLTDDGYYWCREGEVPTGTTQMQVGTRETGLPGGDDVWVFQGALNAIAAYHSSGRISVVADLDPAAAAYVGPRAERVVLGGFPVVRALTAL